MRTIMYQADVRAHDPIGGCYRIIRELQRQIEISRAELEIVLHQLAFCRAHAQNVNNNNNNDNNNHLHEPQHQHQHQHQHDQLLIEGVDFDLDLGQMGQQKDHEYHDGEYILVEQNLNDQDEARVQEMNSWPNMSNSPASSAVCLEVKPPVDECEQFKGLLINEIPAGERHEFKFEFDEINEASEETLFNDGNHKALTKEENVAFFTKEDNGPYQQQNEDNDLKSAATLFTLTNCSSY
ncbi:uncharacterized protein LOC143585911 [Bidens hawaiensis]|uniref:uncharacterized protein LOC143585911 n=1 Tax=Bidens hawaiensis TaxID=980011 RepID=UPI00404A7621